MCSVKNLQLRDKLANVVITHEVWDTKIKEEAESTPNEDEGGPPDSDDDGSQVAARTRYLHIPKKDRVSQRESSESRGSSAERETCDDTVDVTSRHKPHVRETPEKNITYPSTASPMNSVVSVGSREPMPQDVGMGEVGCTVCFEVFSTMAGYKHHINRVKRGILLCHICRKIFHNANEFGMHRASEHKNADWSNYRFKCYYCNLRFTKKNLLQQHIHHFHDLVDILDTTQRTNMEYLEIQGEEIMPKRVRVVQKKKRKRRRKIANSEPDLPVVKKFKRFLATSTLDKSVDEIVKDISNRAENYVIREPCSPPPLIKISSSEVKISRRMQTTTSSMSVESDINDISNLNHTGSNFSEVALPPLIKISSTVYEGDRSNRLPAMSDADISIESIVNDVSNSNHTESNTVDDTSAPPPLVKIFAIPNEVEALLKSDGKNSRKRAREFGDRPDRENISQVSRATEYKYRTPLRSTPLKLPPTIAPPPSTLQHWAMLRRRFNCREIKIQLERIDAPQRCYIPEMSVEAMENNFENELPVCNDSVSTTSYDNKRSVGIELQNLNLALQKLGKLQDDGVESEDILKIPVNLKDGHLVLSKKSRPFYRSAVCKNRFSSQKRLVAHYLAYHRGSTRLECGVCQHMCSGKTDYHKHLTQHCLPISKTEEDGSPFDIKGPCERFKKKFTCRKCKKTFSSNLMLTTHQKLCHNQQYSRSNKSSVKNRRNVPLVTLDDEENDRVQPVKREPLLIEDDSEVEFIPERRRLDGSLISAPVAEHHDHFAAVNSSFSAVNNMDPLRRMSSSSWRSAESTVLAVWPCTVCNTQFRLPENFLQHQKKYAVSKNKECVQCGTKFPSLELYNIHVRYAHTAENPHYRSRCLACNQTFITRDYLRHHIMHIHGEELRQLTEDPQLPSAYVEMECRTCSVIFKNRRHYLEHCLYYFDDDLHACKVCERKFFGRYKAHCHMKKEHFSEERQKKYVNHCTECEESFIYESHLYSHMRHVHPHIPSPRRNISNDRNMRVWDKSVQLPSSLVCHVCDEQFDRIELLIDHEMEYSNQGGFRCALCYRNFFTSILLGHHVKYEHAFTCKEGQKKCMHCQALILESSFNAHVKHFHNNDPGESTLVRGSISSSVQDADVTSTMRLETGKSTDFPADSMHDGDDILSTPENVDPQYKIEYTCALCDLKFSSSSALRLHSQKNLCNTNEFVTCPRFSDTDEPISVCNAESNVKISDIYSVDLAEYEKIRDNDNDNDNDSINEFDSLKITEEMPQDEEEEQEMSENDKNSDDYTCKTCKIKYYTSIALRKHQEEYANAGDYVCNYCPRKFPKKHWSERHERKHKLRNIEQAKGISPIYYCETCDEKFASTRMKHIHFAHIHRLLLSAAEEAEIERERRQMRKKQLEDRLRQRLPQIQTKITDYTSPIIKMTTSPPEISEPVSSIKQEQLPMKSPEKHIPQSPKKSKNSRKKSSRKKSKRYVINHTFDNPLIITENHVSINDYPILEKSKYCQCDEHDEEGLAMEKSLQASLFEDASSCARTRPRIPTKRFKVKTSHLEKIIKKECELKLLKMKKQKKDTEYAITLCDVCGLVFNCKRDLRFHQKTHLTTINDELLEKQSVECPAEAGATGEDRASSEVEKTVEPPAPSVEEEKKEKPVTSSQVLKNSPSIIKLPSPYSNKSQIIHTLLTVKREHDYNQVECKLCPGKFRNSELLGEHLKNVHHLAPNLRTQVCDPIILRRRQMTSNYPESPESTFNYCTICDERVGELEDHIVTHHSSVTTTFPTICESHPPHAISTKIKPRVETETLTPRTTLTATPLSKNFPGLGIVRNITNAKPKNNPSVSGTSVFTASNLKNTEIIVESGKISNEKILITDSSTSDSSGISIVQTGPQVYQLIPIPAKSVLVPNYKSFINLPK